MNHLKILYTWNWNNSETHNIYIHLSLFLHQLWFFLNQIWLFFYREFLAPNLCQQTVSFLCNLQKREEYGRRKMILYRNWKEWAKIEGRYSKENDKTINGRNDFTSCCSLFHPCINWKKKQSWIYNHIFPLYRWNCSAKTLFVSLLLVLIQ